MQGALIMKAFGKIFEKVPLTIYTITLYISPFAGIGLAIGLSELGNKFENEAVQGIFAAAAFISLLICFVFYHIMWFINFIFGAKNAVLASGKGRITGKGCLVYKLIHIPYHFIFFLFCLLWIGAAANPFLMWSYIFLPLAVLHSFCVMLSTSVYGISRAIRLKRDGAITTGKMAAIIILLLIFALDFIGAIMLIFADKAQSENPELYRKE